MKIWYVIKESWKLSKIQTILVLMWLIIIIIQLIQKKESCYLGVSCLFFLSCLDGIRWSALEKYLKERE